MPSFYSVITETGLRRLAEAQHRGVPLLFRSFAVGDGNGSPVTPTAEATALAREVYRGTDLDVSIRDTAPRTVRIEGEIPTASGGWTVRELGLFNGSGELIVYGSIAPSYKPTPAEGATVAMTVRTLIEFATVETAELVVDPNIAVATQADVDDATAGMLYLWEAGYV